MSLTVAQMAAREGRLTASRVGLLMSGSDAAILNLWREMVGDPAWQPDDLSDVWPVQLGSWTEPLHLDWLTRSRPLSRRGEVVEMPLHPHFACTLDAWADDLPGPVECKHVGNWSKLPDIVARYAAQVTWQMLCTQSRQALLSVIIGANEPEVVVVSLDVDYADELLTRAHTFWRAVETLQPPVSLPAIAAPIPVEKLRTVDMAGSNSWAVTAADWLKHRPAAKAFTAAEKDIKAAIEPDVGTAYGHGIRVTRAKNGALTIKPEKADAA